MLRISKRELDIYVGQAINLNCNNSERFKELFLSDKEGLSADETAFIIKRIDTTVRRMVKVQSAMKTVAIRWQDIELVEFNQL